MCTQWIEKEKKKKKEKMNENYEQSTKSYIIFVQSEAGTCKKAHIRERT